MLSERANRYFLRPVFESATLLVLLVGGLGVGALGYIAQDLIGPSLWFQASVYTVEVCAFLSTAFLGAAFVLRTFRIAREEWRMTVRSGRSVQPTEHAESS